VKRRIASNLRHPDQQKESYDPDEVEANRFAAELLMPYHMLGDELKRVDVEDENEIKRVAQEYQVSVQAMTIRVSALLKR
jgi:Zn-dependent peptidase ImmA (M78 family)